LGTATIRLLVLRDPDLVVHFLDAPDAVRDVFGRALRPAIVHRAGERHLAVLHADLDIARVDVAVLGQPLAEILANSVVGALVVARPAPRVLPTPVCAAEATGAVAAGAVTGVDVDVAAAPVATAPLDEA